VFSALDLGSRRVVVDGCRSGGKAVAFPLDEMGSDEALAPLLLCAGTDRLALPDNCRIGPKSWSLRFGAAAHIVAQVGKWQGRSVFAFTRPVTVRPGPSLRASVLYGPGARTRAARTARRSDHLRSGWRSGATGAAGRTEGRSRGLRRHPYERHTKLPLSVIVGRTTSRFGFYSDASGWARLPASGRDRWSGLPSRPGISSLFGWGAIGATQDAIETIPQRPFRRGDVDVELCDQSLPRGMVRNRQVYRIQRQQRIAGEVYLE
jgi:hypothetical protein